MTLLLALAIAGPHPTDQAAFLLSATGAVELTSGGQNARLYPMQPVPTGSTVCTGERSRATLRLATQCTQEGQMADDVQLSTDTCVVVETVFSDVDTRSTVVRVTQGEVYVASNNAEGSLSVVTDAGRTSGTSGGFRVTVEDDAARTEALYEAVAVEAQGATVNLDAGQGSRTVVGEKPGAPVDLLAPGTPRRPGDGDLLRRPTFTWTDVEGALGYRLEFAADRQFEEVLLYQTVGAPPWSPRVLALPWGGEGEVFWRVTSVDRLGFLGVPSRPHLAQLPQGGTL